MSLPRADPSRLGADRARLLRMTRVLWTTGAGSGMGAAIAIAAARAGWHVALSGRRTDRLQQVAAAVTEAGGRAAVLPLDVADPAAVQEASRRIGAELGPVTDVALAAGLNVPRRGWADQSIAEFDTVVRTNLTGVAAVLEAALPDLRRASGVAVVVSSIAGWRPSPVAGVAYSASKSALAAVCRTLNDEEESNGVRATHLCPGDVATEFLDRRPTVPDAEARSRMLQPDDIARAALFVLQSPPHVRIDELVISPCRP